METGRRQEGPGVKGFGELQKVAGQGGAGLPAGEEGGLEGDPTFPSDPHPYQSQGQSCV